jgi:SAM-dependent methyltransferase
VPLAASGKKVVGVDISVPMLAAGRRKAKAAGVEIEFIEGDMRSFDLRREFALVVVSCNSLAHLLTNEDIIQTLRRISGHLAPGGLLAFDIMNPHLAELIGDDRGRKRVEVLGNGSVTEELLSYDPVSQVRVMEWRLNTSGVCRRTEELRLRTIFPQELPLLLRAAGLELAARFGDFDGNPLTAESLNQVCIVRSAKLTSRPGGRRPLGRWAASGLRGRFAAG